MQYGFCIDILLFNLFNLLTDDTKPLPGPMLTDHDWS